MKILSFFNEKGGSGKSTFTLMMASWLRYKEGARVAVFDMDAPMYSIGELRSVDLMNLQTGDRELMKFMSPDADPEKEWYPIEKAPVDGMGEREQDELAAYIISMQDDYDYILLDFGGSLSDGDAVIRFLAKGIVDLFVIPVYTDQTVLLSAMEFCHRASSRGQRVGVFWNRVTRSERPSREKDRLEPLSSLFRREGADVLDTLIPDLTIFRRDSRNWRFVRSTACWPQANIDLMCPSVERLFAEIRTQLDNIDDN